MGKRRRARELALQFLYQHDTLNESSPDSPSVEESLSLFWERDGVNTDSEVKEFSSVLSKGCCANLEQLDDVIVRYSKNWRLSRISKIDRNILRIAVYEMLYLSNIPPAVTINEAVELGKTFGTEESGAFINGILDKIKEDRDKGEL